MSSSWLLMSSLGLKIHQLVAVAVKCVKCHSFTNLLTIQTLFLGARFEFEECHGGVVQDEGKIWPESQAGSQAGKRRW